MLKYLVILLDDTSTSYCHYDVEDREKNLIPLNVLKEGVLFAMKNNLKIQYILPNYTLPQNYIETMESMFNDKIGPIGQELPLSAIVINSLQSININMMDSSIQYVIRTTISDFFENYGILKELFTLGINANIVFVDVMSFTEDKIETYRTVLAELVKSVESSIFKGMNINTNLITDRIALDNMNNCGAGDTSITLAPNGKFYPCPAFYYDDNQYYIIGDIENGLDIKNKTLYKLEYAPLCKRCDAFQCKRCVWLNKKLTYEINTPSRQQCVMSHLEREAGATLLDRFHKHNILLNKTIEKIDYIDPFDNYK